jgi:3-deoxy-D-manno-octulosonate 8-phosphate phosphatase (KDO 8-P phosphatase)
VGYNELLKISTEIKTAWITGRQSFQVEKRAKDMNIDYLVQNCTGKIVALEKILKENGFKTSEMAYMGDDIIDISILRAAGRSVCPMDTCKEVKKYVDYVSSPQRRERHRKGNRTYCESKRQVEKIFGQIYLDMTYKMRSVMNFSKRYVIWFVIIIILFLSVFTFFIHSANKPTVEETLPISEQAIEEFTITETHDGKLGMILKAESAIINESENIAHLKLPIIKFYDKGRYISTFVAESADINMDTYDINGNGKCTVNSANNEYLQTENLIYNAKKELIYSDNNVKITRPSETVYGTSLKSDIKLDKIVIKNQRILID